MQGIDIRLKEVAVRDAIIDALARTGLQPTEGTKVNFLSGPGEPIVVEVTELKAGAPPRQPEPVPVRTEAAVARQPEPVPVRTEAAVARQPEPVPVRTEAAVARQSPKTAHLAARTVPVKNKVTDVEETLFGGQEAWPEAQPYLPDEDGRISMPDAGKHEDGQLDDNEVVHFDAKRFAVAPVPEGESPSLRSTTSRAYEVPDEDDDIPEAYRAGPSPVDE